ncbi:MAG: hypothetical protein WBK91_06430 [Alphaproteobacteria bacterium]
MTATQATETPTQERRSLALSGTQVLGAMAEQGFSPASFSVIPGGNFIGATVLPAEINNDPTTASLIAVQMQMTAPAAMQANSASSDPDAPQRLYMLAVLRKFAQNDPELRRDPLFWAAMANAEKGAGLTARQQHILGRAWAKRTRRFSATRRATREHRAFAGALKIPAAFRHNNYLTMMPVPALMNSSHSVTLGEQFEEALFNKLMPPQPQPSEAGTEGHPLDRHHDRHLDHPHEQRHKPHPRQSLEPKPAPRREMKTRDGATVTAGLAVRPVFAPKMTPSFSDTDSGDEG